jgi:hypothetical protein
VVLLKDAVEKILVNDESKKRYRNLANLVGRLFKAILPDKQAGEFAPVCAAIGTPGPDAYLIDAGGRAVVHRRGVGRPAGSVLKTEAAFSVE